MKKIILSIYFILILFSSIFCSAQLVLNSKIDNFIYPVNYWFTDYISGINYYIPTYYDNTDYSIPQNQPIRYSWFSSAIDKVSDDWLNIDPPKPSISINSSNSNSSSDSHNFIGLSSLQWDQIRSLIEEYSVKNANYYIDCNGEDVWLADDEEESRSYTSWLKVKEITLNKCPSSKLKIVWAVARENILAARDSIETKICRNDENNMVCKQIYGCMTPRYDGGAFCSEIIDNWQDGDKIQLWVRSIPYTDAKNLTSYVANFRILGKLNGSVNHTIGRQPAGYPRIWPREY